jgi:branched-chain amino acid transport system permease protein
MIALPAADRDRALAGMEKTRMGAAVRATVDDAQMARGVGIDTSRISMFIFALGAFLAALGGVIGGAFLGIYPGSTSRFFPWLSRW